MIDKNRLAEKCFTWNIALTGAQLDLLDRYARLLVDYNQKVNLTAITTPEGIEDRHFVDSLLFAAQPEVAGRLVDVGTGAGFPGVPILIARPDIKLVLLDSLNKRLTFLEAVLSELGLSARAKRVHARAEDGGRMDALRGGFDVAFTRAVAPASVALEWTIPFLKVGGTSLLYKGAKAEEELAAAENALSLLSASATIVRYEAPWGERYVIAARKDGKTPKEYPRNAGTAAKKPL